MVVHGIVVVHGMVVLLEAWGASETTSWAAGVDGQGKYLLIG